MQRNLQRHVPGWVGVVGAVGAFLALTVLAGCAGNLDPKLMTGSGGSNGSGGSGSGSGGSGSGSGGSGSGSGGSSSTGGSTGSGGSTNANCTGNNDINFIIMGTGDSKCPGNACNACAQSGCHVPGATSADISGGLDLTLDSNIGSRLIGVSSGTSSNDSACVGDGNYLDANSNPATGLLIKKIQSNPPCGDQMPYPGITHLTSTQIMCVQAWAEGLIMAAQ